MLKLFTGFINYYLMEQLHKLLFETAAKQESCFPCTISDWNPPIVLSCSVETFKLLSQIIIYEAAPSNNNL
jgi:hypothetical protein